jgi:hypothetical protein
MSFKYLNQFEDETYITLLKTTNKVEDIPIRTDIENKTQNIYSDYMDSFKSTNMSLLSSQIPSQIPNIYLILGLISTIIIIRNL